MKTDVWSGMKKVLDLLFSRYIPVLWALPTVIFIGRHGGYDCVGEVARWRAAGREDTAKKESRQAREEALSTIYLPIEGKR